MHKTLKQGAIRPPRATLALYRPSSRAYTGALYALEYPIHFLVKRVTNAGTIRFKTRLLYLSTAPKQHRVGLEEVDDGIWSLFFCGVLLGRIDERKALVNGQLGVTHVPGQLCYLPCRPLTCTTWPGCKLASASRRP